MKTLRHRYTSSWRGFRQESWQSFQSLLRNAVPGPDARYTYMSTFHWQKLVNGYSGYHPPSYLQRLDGLQSFPDASSLEVLQRTGVSYVIVHLSSYKSEKQLLLDLQANPALVVLGRLKDGQGMAIVYRLE